MNSPTLDRLLALSHDLIAIPSTESRPADRARAFALCRKLLRSVDGVTVHDYDSQGFASMVAMSEVVSVPDILLVGHLDVVEHPDVNVYQSRIQDGRLWGPGAGDMKGQCAIMLDLFCDLQRRFPGLSLGIALTSDEERGGEDGVKFLFETVGLRCGMAIVPDGGSINRITVEEKGILQARLRVIGREGHAAAPWLGPNAMATVAQALVRLQDHFASLEDATSPDHWYATCVPTLWSTPNRTINGIPGEVEATVDVRFPAPDTVESMLALLRQVAGPEVIIEPIATAPATRLAPDPLYLRITEEITGKPAQLVRASGGSDSWFIARHGIPVVLSSPIVGNLHREDEWMDIASMELYHRICERFILERLGVG